MAWTSFVRTACLIAALFAFASSARAQLVLQSTTASSAGFPGWAGTGFDPVPAAGDIDSRVWQPFGANVPATPFGSTCVAPICARGTTSPVNLAMGGPGYYALGTSPAFSTPVLAMLASDMGLDPGGVRLQMVNGDATQIFTHADVTIHWARRLGHVATTDMLAITATDCGTSGVTYPLIGGTDAVGMMVGTIRWETHLVTATIDMHAAPIGPGGLVCLAFTIGASASPKDLIALGNVDVTVPPSVCGDGFVDPGEEQCDLGPVATRTACDCDVTCQYPTGACDDGDHNPCTGVCRLGACHATALSTTGYVPACDDGNPCTFEGCVAGVCARLMTCPVPSSTCRTCDPATLTCDVAATGVPGCCANDADCPAGPCTTSACVAGTCSTPTIDPSCADAGRDGGGSDASTQVDASTLLDGGSVIDASTRDAGPGIDGGHEAQIDVGPTPPQFGFAGGGGCRCRVGMRGESSGTLVLAALWMITKLRRRR